jgi:hypothetical protein
MTIYSSQPDVVGRYLVDGSPSFYPVTRAEIARDAYALSRVVATFGISPGRYILTISLSSEVVQFSPFEEAIAQLGLLGVNADATIADAQRTESVCRQFNVAAVCGVNGLVLRGLDELGHDPAVVFKDKIVWARPDAYARLKKLPGLTVRRCAEIGPLLALECAAGGGMHLNGEEWQPGESGGKITLTSRMRRIAPLQALATGLGGAIADSPCGCGTHSPRISLTDQQFAS